MATPTNSKRNEPRTTSLKPGNVPANTHAEPAERDDEHTYDPVGMAGKKAGKVEEIEEQVRKDDPDTERKS
jgi:hypothetical protein